MLFKYVNIIYISGFFPQQCDRQFYVMFHRTFIFLFACLLFSASQTFAQTKNFGLPKNGSFILSVSLGETLLKQCSRIAPANISGYWKPSSSQIAKLETQLPAYIGKITGNHKRVPSNIEYHRQYVGIVVGSKRFIYGNFYPSSLPAQNEQSTPVVICDGGASFWGVVFDLELGQFFELKLNGEA